MLPLQPDEMVIEQFRPFLFSGKANTWTAHSPPPKLRVFGALAGEAGFASAMAGEYSISWYHCRRKYTWAIAEGYSNAPKRTAFFFFFFAVAQAWSTAASLLAEAGGIILNLY